MLARRAPRSGMLALSVDLDPATRPADGMNSAGQSLLRLIAQYKLPATWAVGDPARSVAAEQIAAQSASHEIALLGNRQWTGDDVGRAAFSQELALRVQAGQAHGFEVTTLAVYDSVLENHLDLVMKTGLTAVRGSLDIEGRSRRPAQPHALHYGLWEFPGNVRFPSGRRWGDASRARKALDRAIQLGGLCHVVIDGPRLTAGDTRATVERFLRHVVKRRDAGELRVATLRELAAEKTAPRKSEPARSILRAAG